MISQRDIELESLRNEADQLRKQREALIKAFDGGSVINVNSNFKFYFFLDHLLYNSF
jgi:hypothetical protein